MFIVADLVSLTIESSVQEVPDIFKLNDLHSIGKTLVDL